MLDSVNDIYYILLMKQTDHTARQVHLDHTGNESHLLKELMFTHLALLNYFPKIAKMPTARFALVRMIALSDSQPIGPMEIARRLGVNAAAITRRLKEMEDEQLITRVADPEDARRSYVELTEHGRAVFEGIHQRVHGFEALLRSSLSEAEIATAVKVLAQLRESLTDFSERKEP